MLRTFCLSLLLPLTIHVETSRAQSIGAREGSILVSGWHQRAISKEDRHAAVEKLGIDGVTDEVIEGQFLLGTCPLETTLEWLEANLNTMSDETRFFIARNLLRKLLVVDASGTRIHHVVVRLLGSSSLEVRLQTIYTLHDSPFDVRTNLELCKRIRDALKLELAVDDAEGAVCRRLLYRIQREIGPNDVFEADVNLSLKHVAHDGEVEPESIAEAFVAAATLHEFPLGQSDFAEAETKLDKHSEAIAVVSLVRYLLLEPQKDASKIEAFARKAQRHPALFDLLENGHFTSNKDRDEAKNWVVAAAVSNDATPPFVQLWKLQKKPFQELIDGKSERAWITNQRRNQVSENSKDPGDGCHGDAVVLLAAIDEKQLPLQQSVDSLLQSSSMWNKLYQLENLFLIQRNLGKEGQELLQNENLEWWVKYLIIRELMSPSRRDEVIQPEPVVYLAENDDSPYFVLTRTILSLAKLRGVSLADTKVTTNLRQHVCPDIRRATRNIAP